MLGRTCHYACFWSALRRVPVQNKIGANIHRKHHRHGERKRQSTEEKCNKRHEFRHITRHDVGDKLFDVVEARARPS